MLIDWQYIEYQHQVILAELSVIEPINLWQVQPQQLKTTTHKTKYGMADWQGVVYINQAFLNTSATRLLDVTIRHELAHLCVGLQNGHNQVFKAKASQFGANFNQDLRDDTAQVHAAIGYKYALYATLTNGDKMLFRRAHRKHKKYIHYRAGRFQYLTIGGVKVTGFSYERLSED